MSMTIARRGAFAAAGVEAAAAVDDFNDVALATFDASNDAGVAALFDGDPIETLTDQTGNGHDATQATASKRPVVQTVSGTRVARFDAVDDEMQTGSYATQQPMTYVVLAKLNTTDNVNRRLLQHHDSGGSRQIIYTDNSRWHFYAGTVVDTGTTIDSDWHVHVVVFNAGSSAWYLDGGTPISTANPGSGSGTKPLNLASASGGNYIGADKNLVGTYAGDLTSDDLALMNALGQELANRVGITWTDIS